MFDFGEILVIPWMQEASNLADRLASLVLGRVPSHGDSEAQRKWSTANC